jgi:hypothetical protein
MVLAHAIGKGIVLRVAMMSTLATAHGVGLGVEAKRPQNFNGG